MKANKTQIKRFLNTAKGQIEGIIKMVDDDRYCVDIVHQVMACQAILARVNKDVLSAHLVSCVADSSGTDKEQKVKEVADILDKLL